MAGMIFVRVSVLPAQAYLKKNSCSNKRKRNLRK